MWLRAKAKAKAKAVKRTFSYTKSYVTDVARSARVNLGRNDIVISLVQIWRQGRENYPRYQSSCESIWSVLGRKRVLRTGGGNLIGELGPHNGVIMPRGSHYYIKNIKDQVRDIIQIVVC